VLGILGHVGDIGTLAAWGNIATIAVSTAAVMAIFPRVANIFASAFMPITEAARKRSTKGVRQGDDLYIGINDATGYGEAATLMSGIILIPVLLLLAVLLPGNRTLPLVDLIAISFIIQPFVAASNGNIFKTVVLSGIWFAIGLYICTWTAPLFTQVYSQFATTPLEPGALVTAGMIANKPIVGGLLFLPALNLKWVGIAILLVIYFPLYFLFKRNKVRIQDFMEEQAALDVDEQPKPLEQQPAAV
jgi:PTS system galactitol-specific IIC component